MLLLTVAVPTIRVSSMPAQPWAKPQLLFISETLLPVTVAEVVGEAAARGAPRSATAPSLVRMVLPVKTIPVRPSSPTPPPESESRTAQLAMFSKVLPVTVKVPVMPWPSIP